MRRNRFYEVDPSGLFPVEDDIWQLVVLGNTNGEFLELFLRDVYMLPGCVTKIEHDRARGETRPEFLNDRLLEFIVFAR